MKIGIMGAGAMGTTLARRLAGLGHTVSLASARGPEALTAVAAELRARPVPLVDVAQAELLFLAVPTRAIPTLPGIAFARAPSRLVVVDLGNYHPQLRDGRIEAIEQGLLDSEWVSLQLGRPVLKAFNSIFARSLLEKGAPKGASGRLALPVAGDSPGAKETVLHLVEELGFDPIDAGSLADSWRQGTGTPAYCQDLDAPALRRALAEAQRSRVAEYRAKEEARIRRAMVGD